MEGDAVTDTDIWNWISAFIQSFAETFLLVNVYCAFLGQPRIKKYVAYSLISCFAIAYCVLLTFLRCPRIYDIPYLYAYFLHTQWLGMAPDGSDCLLCARM